jgi:hypothetical protein
MAGMGMGGPIGGDPLVETIEVPDSAVGLGMFLTGRDIDSLLIFSDRTRWRTNQSDPTTIRMPCANGRREYGHWDAPMHSPRTEALH